MIFKTTKPPKNREFLGLVKHKHPYWDFFWWAKKEDGVDKACFIDREFYNMPELYGWTEVPMIDEEYLEEE